MHGVSHCGPAFRPQRTAPALNWAKTCRPAPHELRTRDCQAGDSALPVSLAVAATVFVLLFPAELPDKTALASLILGSRYRPGFVFAGVAAFALHVAFAVAVGSLLTLLPHRAVELVVAVLFLAGALLLLRDEGPRG